MASLLAAIHAPYEVSHGRGSRGIRRPLAPIGGIAKFAMHVVAALANEQTQRDKGLPQHFLVKTR